jgi:hypothetical protein
MAGVPAGIASRAQTSTPRRQSRFAAGRGTGPNRLGGISNLHECPAGYLRLPKAPALRRKLLQKKHLHVEVPYRTNCLYRRLEMPGVAEIFCAPRGRVIVLFLKSNGNKMANLDRMDGARFSNTKFHARGSGLVLLRRLAGDGPGRRFH